MLIDNAFHKLVVSVVTVDISFVYSSTFAINDKYVTRAFSPHLQFNRFQMCCMLNAVYICIINLICVVFLLLLLLLLLLVVCLFSPVKWQWYPFIAICVRTARRLFYDVYIQHSWQSMRS